MVRPARREALRQALQDLERYKIEWELSTFLSNRDAQRMVLQALFVAVQSSIDEAMSEGRARGLPGSEHYRGAFLALGQAGLIEPDLAARLADWASFRNVLTHFYPVLDMRRVYSALGEIKDLRDFLAYLESQEL